MMDRRAALVGMSVAATGAAAIQPRPAQAEPVKAFGVALVHPDDAAFMQDFEIAERAFAGMKSNLLQANSPCPVTRGARHYFMRLHLQVLQGCANLLTDRAAAQKAVLDAAARASQS